MQPIQPDVKKAKRRISRRGATRFPYIGVSAVELGVTRQHLYLVLTGARHSPRCLAGYKAIRVRIEKGGAA